MNIEFLHISERGRMRMNQNKKEIIEAKGRNWKKIARYFQYAVFVTSMILSAIMFYFLMNMEEIIK